jgi:hypothetical protein
VLYRTPNPKRSVRYFLMSEDEAEDFIGIPALASHQERSFVHIHTKEIAINALSLSENIFPELAEVSGATIATLQQS